MTLTASDVASLKSVLGCWELAEYVATGVVFLGCVGEFFAEFTRFPASEGRKHKLRRLSLILVIAGIAGELCATVRTSELSGQIIAYVEENASDAKKSADGAADAAKRAERSATDAESLARAARREADSFEKDIASAKEQAAKAESDLAGALRQATAATAELNRLKSPRSLTNIPSFINSLTEFKGAEYTFSEVFGDEESIGLLRIVDSALTLAGWKRVKPMHRFPSINVYGTGEDFPVPQALTNGVRISVDWPEGLTSELSLLPPDKLPGVIKPAVFLNIAISSHLSPPEEHPQLVDVQKGQSKTVRISIGKKP
jgi:hypothetical protein